MNFREYKLKDLKAMAMYKSKEQELRMNILGKKSLCVWEILCEGYKKYWENLTFRIKKKMFCLITISTGYKNIAIA